MDVDSPTSGSELQSSQSTKTPSQASLSSPMSLATSGKRPIPCSESTTSSSNKLPKISPRATRSSQNPDFAAKQRKFLNRVHDPSRRDTSDSDNSQDFSTPTSSKSVKENKAKSTERKSIGDLKRKLDKDSQLKGLTENDEEGSIKKKRTKEPTKVVGGVDSYCWRCHRDGNVVSCEICPRVFHLKCIQLEAPPPKGWMCPECSTITEAENTDTRSRAMRMLTIDQLCTLLRFALNRMKNYEGAEDFAKPVDMAAFPYCRDFIVKPMDLSQLDRNIKAKMYGSTEAFQADAKWIVHNSIIFNSVQSKFTNTARALLKICRQEMQEIENCPDCYQNAHTRATDSWFIEACRRPHMLVWAKLKGFPFWPAKAMNTNSENLVDVRFFGAHDRAWVPLNQCFLYSKLSPAPSSNKNKRNLEECVQELELHIKKLRDKFGQFEYPPYKTPYDPTNEEAQLAMFLPKYEAKTPGKRVQRISLHQDGARKSILLQKSSPSLKEKLTSEKIPSPVKSPTTILKSASQHKPSSPTHVIPFEKPEPKESNSKTQMLPMVIFPNKLKPTPTNSLAKSSSIASPQKQGDSEKTTSMDNSTPALKKTYKTPLTAAAKKCFATEEKSCFKCKTKATMGWSIDSTGKSLCSSCTLTPPNDNGAQKEKLMRFCVHCQCTISSTWHRGHTGELLCSNCFSSQHEQQEVQFKIHDRNISMGDTNTVQTNQEGLQLNSEEAVDMKDINNIGVECSGPKQHEGATATVSEGAGDGPSNVMQDKPHKPSSTGDVPAPEFTAVDSPPKFIIPKAYGSDSSNNIMLSEQTNKNYVVALEEVLQQVEVPSKEIIEQESEKTIEGNQVIKKTKETKNDRSSTSDEGTLKREDTNKIVQVLLHDLKNNKEMMNKIRENESKKIENISNESILDVQTLLESSSEADTDVSSSVESDSFMTDEESSKKKKQNNINNVVKTLKERKISVEDGGENNKSDKGKEMSTLVLDDYNEDVPVLVIDEGDSIEKKPTAKSDKNRRKGIPAKKCSRSGTSTDSSETASPEERSKSSSEVLDEVSGQFRRASGESNLTITLVTNEDVPQKKTAKEIRSVAISKSLSLSVINDSSGGLEMECVGSDMEDPVIVDSVVKKVMPRPTARKTLPNPSKSIEENSMGTQDKDSESECVKQHLAQSLIDPSSTPISLLHNIRQQMASKINNGFSKEKTTVTATPTITTAKTPVTTTCTSNPRAEIGPANALLEDAVDKVRDQLRSIVEQVLREASEGGVTEATVKAMQIEMERLQWRHRQELAEMKHNTDLVVMEIRASLEAEKQRALLDAKHKYEIEKEHAVQEAKRKQWCAYCQKEGQLHCCWNTSYCSYNCQQSHWMTHMHSCFNKQQDNNVAEVAVPRVGTPRPQYNLPPGQNVRQQMMTPPPNAQPPLYSQGPRFLPNQVYQAVGPRFSTAPRPMPMYPTSPPYPRMLI